jgi:hypothetical protein
MIEELSDGKRLAIAARLINQARNQLQQCSGDIPEDIEDVLATSENVTREYSAIEGIRNYYGDDLEGIDELDEE